MNIAISTNIQNLIQKKSSKKQFTCIEVGIFSYLYILFYKILKSY